MLYWYHAYHISCVGANRNYGTRLGADWVIAAAIGNYVTAREKSVKIYIHKNSWS